MNRTLTTALFAFLPLAPLPAQEDKTEPVKAAQDTRPAAAKAAIDAWLASGMAKADEKLLRDALVAILNEGKPGFEGLRDRIRAVTGDGKEVDKKLAQGLNTLLAQTCLLFLQRELRSNMIFAGQYEPLSALQPYAGEFFLNLVLKTPATFQVQNRPRVIPVLRDLYPEAPPAETVAKLKEIAEDVDFEPADLREALAFALAQWGDRTLLHKRIEGLEKQIASGGEDEKANAQKDLADIYYNMRDYSKSADLHKQYLRAAEKLKMEISPTDYYNAACNMSLAGEIDAALEELQRCIQAGKSPSARPVQQHLFDQDPDLRGVRGDKRFKQIYEAAFPKAGKDAPAKDGKEGKDG
jgi:hypothetical protein